MGGQVCSAPVIDPQQILDIGTGTGIWAIDAGEEYPGATGTFSLLRLMGRAWANAEAVTAIDLSPIQPTW